MNDNTVLIPGQRLNEEDSEIGQQSSDEVRRKRLKIGKLPLTGRIGKPIEKPSICYFPIGDPIKLDQKTIDQVRNVDLSPPDLTYTDTAAEDIHSDRLLQLRNQILATLQENDSVVISLPPGTLKDNAWFLRLTLDSTDLNGKTVVIANATDDPNSPEAKANLARALHTAKYLKQEGVFVEDGGHILCPPYIRNVHTTEPHPLKAINGPEVGLSYMGSPQIKRPPEAIPASNTFNMAGVAKLPAVNIIRVQPGDPENTIKLIEDALKAGAQGIVVGATGNGTVHQDVEKYLLRLAQGANPLSEGRNTPVVISTVVGEGEVSRNGSIQHDDKGFGCSGKLGPEEACIQLQVAMAKKQAASPGNPTLTITETQALFEPYQTPAPIIAKKKADEETSIAVDLSDGPPQIDNVDFSFEEWLSGDRVKDEFFEEIKDAAENQTADVKKKVEEPEATVAPPNSSRKHAKIFGYKLPITIPGTEKPSKVMILVTATGGTISSGGSAKTYSPKLGGADLVKGIGKPSNTHIDVIDVYKKDSKNLEYADLIKLKDSILENYKKYDSIVITHGSDTMAYTANFLRHTLPDEVFNNISIAVTGSMVPTSLSKGSKVKPDGPDNLRRTFKVAEFCARLTEKGQTDHNSVLAVLNELCLETPYIAKKHTTAKGAIAAENAPPVGKVGKNKVELDRAPEPRKWEFNIPDAASIPSVSIFHIESTATPENTIARIQAAFTRGENGVVIAAPPPGKMPTEVKEYLDVVAAEGKKAVVIATSANSGPTLCPDGYKGNLIYAGNLNADMARQFLQLTLADPNAHSKTQELDLTVDPGGKKSTSEKSLKSEDEFGITVMSDSSTKAKSKSAKSAPIDKIKEVFSDYQPKTKTLGPAKKERSSGLKL